MDLDQFSRMAADASVLYVEDEEIIRKPLQTILNRFFKNVFIASDGQEGLECYERERPDLLITDIRMPRMDGLELIERVREIDNDQRVIVISAHEDQAFLWKAINLQVNGYVLKPVQRDNFLETIGNTLTSLWTQKAMLDMQSYLDKRVKKEVERNRRKDQETISMLNGLLEAIPSPIAVYDGQTLSYLNRAMGTLLGDEHYSRLIGTDYSIESAFILCQNEDPARTETSGTAHFVSVRTERGKKIFQLIVRNAELHGRTQQIYTLNDVTRTEYQKIKLRSYNDILEEYIYRRTVKERTAAVAPRPTAPESPPAAPSPQPEVQPEAQPQVHSEPAASTAPQKPMFELESHEEEILRKSRHEQHIPASEYIAEIGDDILDEVRDLQDLEQDIADVFANAGESLGSADIEELSGCFSRYASVMSVLIEFSDLSYVMSSLGNMLGKIDLAQMETGIERKLSVYLQAVLGDLEHWRRTIFTEATASDIHYLDASLFSSCLQIELAVNGKNADAEDEEEELDMDMFF